MGVEQRITIPTIHIRTPQVTHFLHTFPRFREMHPACLPANIVIDCCRRLVWDGENERFVGDEAANRHLKRPYRAPWHL